MVSPPLRARHLNGQNAFDVEEPFVRRGLGDDTARQVQLHPFGNLLGEIRKAGGDDGLCQLLAVIEKLQGLVISLDIDKKPSAPLADVLRLLSDKGFRRSAMAHVASARVRNFWLREYESYPPQRWKRWFSDSL